jgi:hypothetical protein
MGCLARTASVWLLAGASAGLIGGCSSGGSNCINECATTLTITATVPPIDQQTCTVHVCFTTLCGDVTLDASHLSAWDQYSDYVTVGSHNGAWQLKVQVDVGSPESGRAAKRGRSMS